MVGSASKAVGVFRCQKKRLLFNGIVRCSWPQLHISTVDKACGVLFRGETASLQKQSKGQGAAPHTFAKCPWAFHSPQVFQSSLFCCFNKKSKMFLDRCPLQIFVQIVTEKLHISQKGSRLIEPRLYLGQAALRERAPNAQATPSNHMFKAKTYKSTSCHIEISPLEVLSCSSANYKQRCSALHAIMLQLTS